MRTNRLFLFLGVLVALPALTATGCGSPEDDLGPTIPDAAPPDGFYFNPGDGGGVGDAEGGLPPVPDTGPADTRVVCDDEWKRCAETFTYPFAGESSVELRGDYRDGAWVAGDPLQHVGSSWTVSVPVPYAQPVQYKYFVNGATWVTDPGNPSTITDPQGDVNSVKSPLTCADWTCAEPSAPPPGVYDWRDAVIYFVFVDRFFDGDPSNNGAPVAGVQPPGAYQGGDWRGVTSKIQAGYFNTLGVNTLWITVPIKNADTFAGLGTSPDTHLYSAYHGYWPYDLTTIEERFGTADDLKGLVSAAHGKGLKVLFDFAMVHVEKDSPLYQLHPDWFWPNSYQGHDCVCGFGCSWDTQYQQCWFTDYLPHWNYTVDAAREYSITSVMSLVETYEPDGMRLDAIKHVDGSWLLELRSKLTSDVVAVESPPQRFYLVGETYDFGNRDFIKSFVDPSTKLDGQFDFPLRLNIVQSILMRTNPMSDLAAFMDSNEDFYGIDAVMSTFVGNHDLPRSIHIGDDTPLWGDPYNDGKNLSWSGQPALPNHRSPFERLANALALILTNKGAPLIYYGDEIGLPGAGDPDNRRFMEWTGLSADQTWLHDRVAALTAIRAAHPALRRGKRITLEVGNDLWLYEMTAPASGTQAADTVYVAINRGDGDQSTTKLPTGSWKELVTGTTATGPITNIPARQTRVFVAP